MYFIMKLLKKPFFCLTIEIAWLAIYKIPKCDIFWRSFLKIDDAKKNSYQLDNTQG